MAKAKAINASTETKPANPSPTNQTSKRKAQCMDLAEAGDSGVVADIKRVRKCVPDYKNGAQSSLAP